MAVKLRRPILVGGVGLSFSLWLLQSLHHSVAPLGEFGFIGAIALGALLLLPRLANNLELSTPATPLDRATVEVAIAEAEGVIAQLDTEAGQDASTPLRSRLAQLTPELERQELQIAVLGGKGVGKTSLIQVLEASWVPQQPQPLRLQEAPTLFVSKAPQLESQMTARDVALTSDLVLFVTAGDLTDPELQTLQQLRATEQQVILVFNKQDQYLPTERSLVLQQLRRRLEGLIAANDVVATSAAPKAVKVRQHQQDASVQEWLEEQPPALSLLTERLNQIVIQEAQQLVWASTNRAVAALNAEAKAGLNQVRRDRALPVIEQYQWIAAAAAFANPMPALDILATAAISAQLVNDLGEIYQQKFSWQQAQAASKTLGSLMLKLGVVELSTQLIGSVLKGHAFTYVAGGAVQGVSAAYLTRLAGLSLIEYFQDDSDTSATGQLLNLARLGQKLQTVFQQNQRAVVLQGFVKQVVGRLVPKSPPELKASEITTA